MTNTTQNAIRTAALQLAKGDALVMQRLTDEVVAYFTEHRLADESQFAGRLSANVWCRDRLHNIGCGEAL